MMRKLATDRAGLEILHLGDCFGLLGSAPVGRIGFMAGGEVVILPVNFLVDGQDVVFRTAAGSKLSALEIGHYVAFEADSYDAASQQGLVGLDSLELVPAGVAVDLGGVGPRLE